MNCFLIPLTIFALVGAGVVTGLLFAFSNFVMRALGEIQADQGALAMQRINAHIINPVFLLFFLVTPLACAFIVFQTLGNISAPGYPMLTAGAILYLIGPFAITVMKNVPLNNKLASLEAEEAASYWPAYRKTWQLWNHIRSYLGILSLACLASGLSSL